MLTSPDGSILIHDRTPCPRFFFGPTGGGGGAPAPPNPPPTPPAPPNPPPPPPRRPLVTALVPVPPDAIEPDADEADPRSLLAAVPV
ncbi:unnamed protein product [Closterium sp. NIES-53]